jgi:hypothetical protein
MARRLSGVNNPFGSRRENRQNQIQPLPLAEQTQLYHNHHQRVERFKDAWL